VKVTSLAVVILSGAKDARVGARWNDRLDPSLRSG
jgi:RES domain-containing protein